MRSATAGSLALLLLSQFARAEEKVRLNTITKVQVKGASIEIVGNQKPNFTTFTMTDPPRLVVDISEAVFSGVQEQMDIATGPIMGIKTASYGSDTSAIARVLIGFQREVETDLQVKGTSLIIRVTPSGAAPAVADEKAGNKAGNKAGVVAAPDVKVESEVQAAQETARAEQERDAEQQRLSERERKAEEARLARAEEARKREEAKQALAEEKQRQKEEAEAKRRAAEEEKQAKLAAAEEKKQQEREAREAKKREVEQAKLAKQQAAEEAKIAKQKAAEDARLAKQQAAEEAKLARQKKAEEAEAPKVAARETARMMPDSSERISVSSRRKTVALVGFKQQTAASRVFVQTNEPVRYTVSEGQGKTVILQLENTSIGPSNNSRFLDTSYFDTAVAMVTPSQGPTRSVRIEIRLKEAVPFETHQEGNEVFLDFPRPAKR